MHSRFGRVLKRPAGRGRTNFLARRKRDPTGGAAQRGPRIWNANGLKPHLVKTFKLSNDPLFVEKLTDVVGLYMNPPEHALILSIDEKSQMQGLDRTPPGLPMKKGRAGTMTHDYKRNGTTTWFAAWDVLKGEVIGQCMKRHRHQEFLKFLKAIDRSTPKNHDIHCIVDTYATPIRSRKSAHGWKSTRASTSTSSQRRHGSISSSAGSETSRISASEEALTHPSPSWRRPSSNTSRIITKPRNLSSGRNPRNSSYERSIVVKPCWGHYTNVPSLELAAAQQNAA